MTRATEAKQRERRPRDERSEEILEAARRLFSLRGYRGTTIAEVARSVGITDAGVLHHYSTKRELLAAVLERSTEHQAEMLRDLLDTGGVEALRSFGDWGTVMEAEPYHMGLEVALSAEALDGESQLRDFFTKRYRVLRRWLIRTIEDCITAGEVLPDVDVEFEVSALVAYLDGMRLQWFFGTNTALGTGVRTYVDQMLDRISVDGPTVSEARR